MNWQVMYIKFVLSEHVTVKMLWRWKMCLLQKNLHWCGLKAHSQVTCWHKQERSADFITVVYLQILNYTNSCFYKQKLWFLVSQLLHSLIFRIYFLARKEKADWQSFYSKLFQLCSHLISSVNSLNIVNMI